MPSPEPFNVDTWEKACNDAYYAAERCCNEEHQKCLAEGGIDCERQLKQCLSRAEFEMDACIEAGRQLWLASKENGSRSN